MTSEVIGPNRRQEPPSPRDVVFATAGHVDHGKSALVRVLTGTDPDRLPEERRRGMTIELGFASLVRPDGGRLAFIDVPGHERLVETVVAGVGGIDAALLVVAADDGPMPQTIEHLTILGLLGVRDIVVALTKIDLVDDDWLQLATLTTRELLIAHGYVDAPIVPVSALTGVGVEDLTSRLLAVTPGSCSSCSDEPNWLSIDRAFLGHGVGTIVAGTLASGQLQRGRTVGVWPGGQHASIRGMESHGEPLDTAIAGQRVAVNLAGINLDQVRRGDVISDSPVPATDSVDIVFGPAVSTQRSFRSGVMVRVVIGTDRVDAIIQFPRPAHVIAQTPSLARLRFRRPVATRIGARLIIRQPSPPLTVGGGVVLARHSGRPPRLDAARLEELAALAAGNPEPTLRRRLAVGPASIEELMQELPGGAEVALRRWLVDGTIRRLEPVQAPLAELGRSSRVVSESVWSRFAVDLDDQVRSFHLASPEAPGLPLAALRSRLAPHGRDLDDMLTLAVRQGRVAKLDGMIAVSGYRPRLRESEREAVQQLLARLAVQDHVEVISIHHLLPSTIGHLTRLDQIVRIDDHRIMATGQFERVAGWVIETSQAEAVQLATIRDHLRLGRGATQSVLEYLDELGLTIRREDGRYPGPAASAWIAAGRARYIRRLGQSILHDWTDRFSTTSISPDRQLDAVDIVVYAKRDDSIPGVSSGPALMAMMRTGQCVVSVPVERSQDGISNRPLDVESIAIGARSWDEPRPDSIASLLERIMSFRAGVHQSIRVIAPLELAEEFGVVSWPGTAGDEADGGLDLLLYEDQMDLSGSEATLATRLGTLIDRGFRIEPFAVSFMPEDLEASVDAIMAEPGAVASLALRYGLDPDRTAILNLMAGYHRSLTDHGLTQRFWRVRQGPTQMTALENRDRHAI